MLMEVPSANATTADGPSGFRLSATAINYAKRVRKVSRETLERFGVGSGTTYFGDLAAKSDAVFFPYYVHGELVNWKAAAFPEKSFTSLKGGRSALFNLDAVKNSETVYLTEGEWDCISLCEAGLPVNMVASVPGGAPDKKREDGAPRNYRWAEDALEAGLKRAKRIVWCGDMDGPGHLLREDMAEILGAARFWFVDWPEGCKDASDMLRTDGPAELLDRVTNGALPWPIDGVYTLDEIPETAPLTTWSTGFDGWDKKIMLAPRTLSVLTGHGGHGKTTLFAQIWFHIVRRYGLVAGIATFETRAKPAYRQLLRQFYASKLHFHMTDIEIREADNAIRDHYRFLIRKDHPPTLEWLLDKAEVAVVRHGASIIEIDPWNRVESQRRSGESETDYILRCLLALYNFANDMNVHVQVAAHPAKRDPRLKDRAPDLEDVAGSKAWETVPDQGFTVHRKKFWDEKVGRLYDAELYHQKARFDELGHRCVVDVRLDPQTWRFESVTEG